MRVSKVHRSFLLTAAVVAFLSSSAQAENWFFVVDSDDGTNFFLDRDSIKRKGDFSEVKTFEVRQKPDDDGTIAMVVTREYSCREKKSRVRQPVALFTDQSTRAFKDITAWEPVKADTVDAALLKKACESR
ncbi:MAG: surface-adhesin E family protein [Leptolyngbya sp. BL-A-14]